MTSRIPEPPSEFEAEGIPDPGDNDADLEASGDQAYELSVPRDHASAVNDFGTTALEEETGESLDGRLAREVPDVLNDESVAASPRDDELTTPEDDPVAVGRLVQDDEGAHGDTTAETVAHDVGTDLGGYSAEESAMHVTSGDED